ncbi:hypothetical protein POSPLADRAFT_1040015 [Postia placenta MAD-698-R-SB12]|uniref:glutathione transferase n=1 Tax=Postia placenta MAD-698-R-SB12 TaxID=670580 RepID=A0A1X6N127_9APHY|nr:hypothetical protein POSPLADRAFT_1040015 [Postia placenta MAD-698-R-SB12]OSX62329.1 hypothetical protein POSPLADRAFT_1040015 [Postia placenta MAD-698-R-SB12]
MVLKLHGFPLSTCTRRVALVLKEKNVPYKLVPVDLTKNENKSPSYLANQPFGQVPYIVDDDGFQLFESRAIGRYIALKYPDQGNKLMPDPADLKKTALFEQAASIELSNFDPLASTLAFERLVKPRRGLGETNEALVAQITQQLGAKLDVYEVILSKTKYLAGEEVSLADLFHIPYGSMLGMMRIDLGSETRPNVARWWKDITSRPSWVSVKDGA